MEVILYLLSMSMFVLALYADEIEQLKDEQVGIYVFSLLLLGMSISFQIDRLMKKLDK